VRGENKTQQYSLLPARRSTSTYWTAQKLAVLADMSSVCTNCNKAPEMVVYALVECRPVNTSWNRVQGVMLIRFGQHLGTISILTLQMKQRPR
jgi:hypothetical protein